MHAQRLNRHPTTSIRPVVPKTVMKYQCLFTSSAPHRRCLHQQLNTVIVNFSLIIIWTQYLTLLFPLLTIATITAIIVLVTAIYYSRQSPQIPYHHNHIMNRPSPQIPYHRNHIMTRPSPQIPYRHNDIMTRPSPQIPYHRNHIMNRPSPQIPYRHNHIMTRPSPQIPYRHNDTKKTVAYQRICTSFRDCLQGSLAL